VEGPRKWTVGQGAFVRGSRRNSNRRTALFWVFRRRVHYSLRSGTEERSSSPIRGGSLIWRKL